MIAENKDYESPLQQRLSRLGLAAIGIAWITAMLLAKSPVDEATAGTAILLMVIALGSYACAFLRAAALVRAFAVLNGQRVPSSLWRQAAARFIRRMTLAWLGIGLVGALQIVLCSSRAGWSAPLALSALALSAGAALPLSRRNLLPFRRHKAVLYGQAALLALVLLLGPVELLKPFMALPAPLLLAVAMAWPATALALHRHWQAPPPHGKADHTTGMKLWQPSLSYLRRFHPLLWHPAMENSAADAERTFPGMSFASGFHLILLAIMVPNWLGKPWGAQLSVINIFMLALLCANGASALTILDLHWRSFIMPGGLKRGRIGTSILLSTMQIISLCWLLEGAIVFLFSLAFLDKTPLAILQSFAAHLIALPEMIFVVSFGIALRSALPMVFGWFASLACLGGWATYLAYQDLPLAPLEALAVGPAYLAFLLAGSAVLIAFANRRWTRQRLLGTTRFGMPAKAAIDSAR